MAAAKISARRAWVRWVPSLPWTPRWHRFDSSRRLWLADGGGDPKTPGGTMGDPMDTGENDWKMMENENRKISQSENMSEIQMPYCSDKAMWKFFCLIWVSPSHPCD